MAFWLDWSVKKPFIDWSGLIIVHQNLVLFAKLNNATIESLVTISFSTLYCIQGRIGCPGRPCGHRTFHQVRDCLCKMHTKEIEDDARYYCWWKQKQSSMFDPYQRWRRLVVFGLNSLKSMATECVWTKWVQTWAESWRADPGTVLLVAQTCNKWADRAL